MKDVDSAYPGFFWYMWAARQGRRRLRNVRVADTVILINGRVKAWIFYSKVENRVSTDKRNSPLEVASLYRRAHGRADFVQKTTEYYVGGNLGSVL
jgi:hypothetical protein